MNKLILVVLTFLTLAGCCKPPVYVDTFCHKYQLVKTTDKGWCGLSKEEKQTIMANNYQYLKDCVDKN